MLYLMDRPKFYDQVLVASPERLNPHKTHAHVPTELVAEAVTEVRATCTAEQAGELEEEDISCQLGVQEFVTRDDCVFIGLVACAGCDAPDRALKKTSGPELTHMRLRPR